MGAFAFTVHDASGQQCTFTALIQRRKRGQVTDITSADPLLSPQHVSVLTDQLAKLHRVIANLNRIESCGFECGDLRASTHALAQTIERMLTNLGNVPPGMVPQPQGQPPTRPPLVEQAK